MLRQLITNPQSFPTKTTLSSLSLDPSNKARAFTNLVPFLITARNYTSASNVPYHWKHDSSFKAPECQLQAKFSECQVAAPDFNWPEFSLQDLLPCETHVRAYIIY